MVTRVRVTPCYKVLERFATLGRTTPTAVDAGSLPGVARFWHSLPSATTLFVAFAHAAPLSCSGTPAACCCPTLRSSSVGMGVLLRSHDQQNEQGTSQRCIPLTLWVQANCQLSSRYVIATPRGI